MQGERPGRLDGRIVDLLREALAGVAIALPLTHSHLFLLTSSFFN